MLSLERRRSQKRMSLTNRRQSKSFGRILFDYERGLALCCTQRIRFENKHGLHLSCETPGGKGGESNDVKRYARRTGL